MNTVWIRLVRSSLNNGQEEEPGFNVCAVQVLPIILSKW